MSGTRLKRMTRWRMARTGEKYTAARRALLEDPAAMAEARRADQTRDLRRKYPFTDRDGLGLREVPTAFETKRRRH